jgi:hypothetical protein
LNFKFFTLLILLVFISSCGVKSDPIAPEGTAIPSYLNRYVDTPPKAEEEKDKKVLLKKSE